MTNNPEDPPGVGWPVPPMPPSPPPWPPAPGAPPLSYGGYGWTPTPGPSPRRRGASGRTRGLVGGLAAVIVGAIKYGFLLLKFSKYGLSLLSLGASLLIFIGLYGPAFGVGLLAMIAIHEVGHMVVGRLFGVRVSTPTFLGPFGAFVRYRLPRDDGGRISSLLALGGPLAGTVAAAAVLLWANLVGHGGSVYPALALAYFGALLNLLNLIPFFILDGAKVARGFSWEVAAAVALLLGAAGVAIISLGGPFPLMLFLVVVGFAILAIERARHRHGIGQTPQILAHQLLVAGGLLATGLLAAVIMSEASQMLLAAGYRVSSL